MLFKQDNKIIKKLLSKLLKQNSTNFTHNLSSEFYKILADQSFIKRQ